MEKVILDLNEEGVGKFAVMQGEKQLGEMEVGIQHNTMTVYHTEVLPEAEGRGLAKLMLHEMVSHARKNGLTIKPLCTYVQAQFKRHPQDYEDVWSQ